MTARPRARSGRKGPRRSASKKKGGFPVVSVAGVLAAATALAGAGLIFAPGPAARNGPKIRVVIAPHTRLPAVASQLASAGVIRWPAAFIGAAEITGWARQLKAGEYSFPSRASLVRVLRMLRDGDVVRHFITIPEGLTSAQAVAILDAAPELTGAAPAPAEGALLPETYQVAFGETRAHVIGRMQAAMSDLLHNLWASRAGGLPYGSPRDAVILASIVEKETAAPTERPHVAAVYLNRLRHGVRLDSDPTVVYGLTGGAPLGHGLRVSELKRNTAYNTYVNTGLPPTPIANPGRASLEAALHPSQSDDLYFVANGAGGHAFSSTLAAHLKNVARWRVIERSQAAPGFKGGGGG